MKGGVIVATNLGTAIGYLTLDITGFTRGIDEATRQMDRMGSGTASTLANMGTNISKVGTAMTAAITAPVIGFGASILREGTTFEEAMTKVKNVANMANSDIGSFRQAVKDLGFQMTETGNDAESMFMTMYNYAVNQGSQTRFTAEEVASALYYMGLAGWDATKMMQGLRPVLDLAAATGEDLARVSDIVTDSMNALGIEVKDLSSYTNVLAEMTRSSNTTLDQAGEAFKYVAPLAGALGYTMQDLAIAIGEFANVGVKGSQAGTGLRQALNSLTNPSERAMEVMDRLNWSIYDMYGNAKPLMQVMTELRQMFGNTAMPQEALDSFSEFIQYLEEIGQVETFENLSLREQTEMFSEWASTVGKDGQTLVTEYQKVADVIKLVGVRALPGILGIINATDENFNSLTNAVYGADKAYGGLGTSVGMADELMDTTQGSIYKLTSSISELRIQLFEFLKGPFREIIDKLTDVIKWFNNLDDSTQRNILNWAGIAAAIGPVLVTIGKLMTGIANLSTGFKLAGISKDGFAKNVTGTLKPAVEKGTAATSGFGAALSKIGSVFKTVLKVIGGVGSIIGGIIAVVVGVVDAIKNGYDVIHAILITLGTALAALGAILLGAPAAITAIVAAIVAVVANLVAAIGANWDKIKEGLAKAWESIKDFFSKIGTIIGEAIKKFGEFIANLWNGFTSFIGDVFSKLGTFLSNIVSSVGQFFGNLFSNIGSALSNIWSSISQWFTNLIGNIGQWFSGIFNNLKSLLSSALDLVTSIGQSIWSGIQTVFSMISDGISTLAGFFKNIFDTLLNGVMSALQGIGSAISGFINGIVNTITNTISAIVGFIAGLAQSIGEALTGVFNTLKGFFESFINSLSNVLSGIGSWISGVISELGNFIKSIWSSITQLVSEFGSGIAEVLDSIGKGLSELVGSIGKGIGDFLKGITTKISDGIKGIVDGIKNGFANIWQSVYDIGKNIIMGIYEGLKAGVTWLGDGLGNICNSIVDGVKKVLKISSPSKVFADEVGRWLPPGIVDGFEDAMPAAERDINDSIDDLIDNVNAEDASVSLGTSYGTLQTVLADSYSDFADSVETTEDRINRSLDSIYEKMYNLVMLEKQLTDGIITNTGYNVPTTNGASGNGTGAVTNNSGGNTFIFNSPKPIDEIEAARQVEKTQRELEEGFM